MVQQFKLIFVFVFLFFTGYSFAGKQYTLNSPDGKIEVTVSVGHFIEYAVTHASDVMIAPSPISVELDNGVVWGVDPKLQRASTRTVNEIIPTTIYKKKEVSDHFNELTLIFKGDYRVIFRAYDDGVAYRFASTSKKPFRVKSEQAVFNFLADYKAYIPYVRMERINSFEEQFFNSFENVYAHTNLSLWDKKRCAFAPLLIEAHNGKKICLTEADLINYPGMYLYNGDGSTSLKGVFAPYPKEVKQGGHNELQMLVKSREEYIAAFDKGTEFPWRTIIIAENDHELADNDMVYKLATPTVTMDFSWVKPGKVAWDWWNDWNLYNVDFKAGINNETYKYYIDFASKYGIEYVILDEGWAVNRQADLFQVIPEINLEDLTAYAKTKNVGLILWAGYHAFDRDMERVCEHYSKMGIKGFKVDFMDRDDQYMVDFLRRGAEMAATHKLLIDYHGTHKPTGLQRTYPNVINFEGVHGLEQMKWSSPSVDQVVYDVTIPFIRQVAGPMDYTQGAMRNASKNNYRPVYSEAMSQGTRCRQLAQYVIFESPLNMLCDNPSNYEAEKECTELIASIPAVWDESKALNGEVAEYVSIARRSGSDWYVASMTDWNAREMELDLSFLGKGNYKAVIFRDGINADRAARDYKKEVITIPDNRKLTIRMAPGGGWIARIYRIEQ
jgi:alpha-glucosidase